MNWHNLESTAELDQLLAGKDTFLIFKHSTRCPVSSAAKRRFETDWFKQDRPIPAYYLDLIEYRDVSNKIATELGVVHQSPQLILVHQKAVLHHSSHTSISADKVLKHIENLSFV